MPGGALKLAANPWPAVTVGRVPNRKSEPRNGGYAADSGRAFEKGPNPWLQLSVCGTLLG